MIVGFLLITPVIFISALVVILIVKIDSFSKTIIGFLEYSGISKEKSKKIAKEIVKTRVSMIMNNSDINEITAVNETYLVRSMNRPAAEVMKLAVEYANKGV
jgi:hypothetical protein